MTSGILLVTAAWRDSDVWLPTLPPAGGPGATPRGDQLARLRRTGRSPAASGPRPVQTDQPRRPLRPNRVVAEREPDRGQGSQVVQGEACPAGTFPNVANVGGTRQPSSRGQLMTVEIGPPRRQGESTSLWVPSID